MDAIKFLKESSRLCRSLTNSGCKECPIYPFYRYGCILYSEVKPERMDELKRAISILEQWAKENPEKTRLQDFVDRNPNAPLTEAGYPMMYPKHMGYCKTMDCTECEHLYKNQLTECWDLPLED